MREGSSGGRPARAMPRRPCPRSPAPLLRPLLLLLCALTPGAPELASGGWPTPSHPGRPGSATVPTPPGSLYPFLTSADPSSAWGQGRPWCWGQGWDRAGRGCTSRDPNPQPPLLSHRSRLSPGISALHHCSFPTAGAAVRASVLGELWSRGAGRSVKDSASRPLPQWGSPGKRGERDCAGEGAGLCGSPAAPPIPATASGWPSQATVSLGPGSRAAPALPASPSPKV